MRYGKADDLWSRQLACRIERMLECGLLFLMGLRLMTQGILWGSSRPHGADHDATSTFNSVNIYANMNEFVPSRNADNDIIRRSATHRRSFYSPARLGLSRSCPVAKTSENRDCARKHDVLCLDDGQLRRQVSEYPTGTNQGMASQATCRAK